MTKSLVGRLVPEQLLRRAGVHVPHLHPLGAAARG
jgi:hypothetical protein